MPLKLRRAPAKLAVLFTFLVVIFSMLWTSSLYTLSTRTMMKAHHDDLAAHPAMVEGTRAMSPQPNRSIPSLNVGSNMQKIENKQVQSPRNNVESLSSVQASFQERCRNRLRKLVEASPQGGWQLDDDCHTNITGKEDWDVKAYFAAGGNAHRYSSRRRFLAATKQKYFCIDIGGNIGVDSLQLYEDGYCKTLEIFEILPDLSTRLRRKFSKFDNVCVSEAGVGHDRQSAWLHKKGPNDEATFINQEASPLAQQVEIIGAAQYVELLVEEGHRDLYILMNCEGCEYSVINSLGAAGLLHFVKVLEVQPHKQDLTSYPLEEWKKQECWLTKYMSASHELKFGFFLVWNIWILRN
jgi:FkbM family methyltransferase